MIPFPRFIFLKNTAVIYCMYIHVHIQVHVAHVQFALINILNRSLVRSLKGHHLQSVVRRLYLRLHLPSCKRLAVAAVSCMAVNKSDRNQHDPLVQCVCRCVCTCTCMHISSFMVQDSMLKMCYSFTYTSH